MGNNGSSARHALDESSLALSKKSKTTVAGSSAKKKKPRKVKPTHAEKSHQELIKDVWQSGLPGEAERMAKHWVQCKNDHNMMKLMHLADPDATFRFPDVGLVIPMRDFLDTMLGLVDAFPDLHFTYGSIGELRPGVVVLTEYFAIGTHTGSAFECNGEPAVPPTGITIRTGPMIQTIKVQHGKVIDLECVAPLGNSTGPPAFFEATKKEYERQQRSKSN